MIVVSNHIGLFDPFALLAACSRRGLHPRFLATSGMFTVPVFGRIMRACGHIPVDRGRRTAVDALRHATEALRDGSCVVLYPEGRVSLDPGMWPERAKTGAARLVRDTGAPVLAVAQWGAHEVTAWDRPGAIVGGLLRSLLLRPVVRVHFAEVVDLSDLDPDDGGFTRGASDRFTAATLEALQRLRGEEPVMPRHIDHTRPLSAARTFRRGG